MAAKTKISPWLIVGIIAVIVLILYFNKPREAEQIEIEQPAPSNGGSGLKTKPSLTKLGNDTVLKRGTKAAEVAWVQYYYNKYYAAVNSKPKLTQDGIFGAKTEAAVKTVVGTPSTTWTQFKRTLDGNTPTYNPGTPDWSGNSGYPFYSNYPFQH